MRGVTDNSSFFTQPTASQAAGLNPGGRAEGQPAQAGFFGEGGASFRDVLDAVNPLNHIPFVSGALETETGHKISTASKLIGGVLLGGPIGLVAGIANAVFEQATGKSAPEAVFAALTGGNDENIQLAEAEQTQPPQELAENSIAAAPVPDVEVAELAPPANKKPMQLADISGLADQNARDRALLSLYGASSPSAHSSYKKAQMLPYLKDVTVSRVL